jgi:voltage-gated potassium channel
MLSPLTLLDMLAILPFYLPINLDLRFLRALRLFRAFRLLKVGRYNSSLKLIRNVFIDKREEIVLSLSMMAILLLFSACLLYFIENKSQPQAFSSIPAAMWWAVTALTTVGYGDIYPITPLGKLIASIIAISGIGMFALPAGIISSGFVESIQRRKQEHIRQDDVIHCPHCGEQFHHSKKNHE